MKRTAKTGYTKNRAYLLKKAGISFSVKDDKIVTVGVHSSGKNLLDNLFELMREERLINPTFNLND